MSFAWHEAAQMIEDASWVKVTREALSMERKAWEAAHADRLRLQARVHDLEAGVAPTVVTFKLQADDLIEGVTFSVEPNPPLPTNPAEPQAD